MKRSKMTRMIAENNAATIETVARQARKGRARGFQWSYKNKKAIMWTSGRCKICGECYEVLTLHHAERHGFASKEEMIQAGAVEPIEVGGVSTYTGEDV